MKRQVKICFWGVRGSVAAAGKHTVKYGGNTICVEIRYKDTLIICDAGSGIRPFGSVLRAHEKKPIKATILLSHLHWDHLMGLPFFEPLYDEENHFLIAAPVEGKKSFKRVLGGIVSPPYFPISLDEFTASMHYRTLTGRPFCIDKVVVEPFSCYHPGGSLGWKFIIPDGTKVIHISDNEPSLRNRERMLAWMEGADVVIHDTQYSQREYGQHRGWGHSPYTYPVEMAIAARCKRLYLFHYDPATDDRKLERRLVKAREIVSRYRSKLKVHLAREGKTVAV